MKLHNTLKDCFSDSAECLNLDFQKKLFLICIKPMYEMNKCTKIAPFWSLCNMIMNRSEAFYERNFNDGLPNVNCVSV